MGEGEKMKIFDRALDKIEKVLKDIENSDPNKYKEIMSELKSILESVDMGIEKVLKKKDKEIEKLNGKINEFYDEQKWDF